MNKMLKTSIATTIALGSKCYGEVEAGKNGCSGKVSSCEGKSKIGGQADTSFALPNGLCEKLVG